MPRWVSIENGYYVNLDQCDEIRPFRRERNARLGGGKETAYLISRASGETGIINEWGFTPDHLSNVYVPAVANACAFIISASSPNGRPTEGDVDVRAVPVIAWAIDQTGSVPTATPVLLNSRTEDESVFIPAPDHSLIDEYGDALPSLDDAKRQALRHAQDEWDAKADRQDVTA
jgi:hypothetical protein